MLTLVVITPDGTVTRNGPVAHGPLVAMAIEVVLRPYTLSRIQAQKVAMTIIGALDGGHTYTHTPSGYRFRIETATPVPAAVTA